MLRRKVGLSKLPDCKFLRKPYFFPSVFSPYNCCQIFLSWDTVLFSPSHLPRCQNGHPQVYPQDKTGCSPHSASGASSQKSCWIRRFHLEVPHKVQPPVGKNKCPNRGLHTLALSGGGALQTQHPCYASSLYSGFQSVAGTSTARKEASHHKDGLLLTADSLHLHSPHSPAWK